MKEKKYFCDYYDYYYNMPPIKYLLSTLGIMLAVSILIGLVSYNVILSKNKSELASYNESRVASERLEEIVDDVIEENKGIDLLALPKDVITYEVIKKDNDVIFKCSMHNAKDMFFVSNASAEVKLSPNYEIISKKIIYSSEEEFIDDVMSNMIFMAGVIAAVGFVIIFFVGLPCCSLAANISKKRKFKNMQN